MTHQDSRAWLIGGGIGALAAAAFLIRDGGLDGRNITLFDALPLPGGSLDGGGDALHGYTLRGGRMFTTDNYECTWDLFKSIPSLEHAGQSVYDETLAFNALHVSHAKARLVDRNRARVDVASLDMTMADRAQLLKLAATAEADLGDSAISDWFAPSFFNGKFWLMWATTFAFQPWHSAAECRRYLHRFVMEFPRIETLAGVKRTVYNQYDALVKPLCHWLRARGVVWRPGCRVADLALVEHDGRLAVGAIGLRGAAGDEGEGIAVGRYDLVFVQNGSMTDAASYGAMHRAPEKLGKADSLSWDLWEKLAHGRPGFGRPAAFNGSIPESCWHSFTVTLNDPAFFAAMERFTGNRAGTGGLVTFRDSRWLLSVVLAHQPHFAGQPAGVQVFWGYALHPDRVGDFIGKPMADCGGADILRELCGHLRFDPALLDGAICIPCRMPYITSMFMPRLPGDRPPPVPPNTHNLALVGQFVELPDDVVFTVEYSVRAAQTAVYQLLGIEREIPPVHRYDHTPTALLQALAKAFA